MAAPEHDSMQQRLWLWLAGSKFEFWAQRGQQRLLHAAQQDPSVLARRMIELGETHPRRRRIAADLIANHLRILRQWPERWQAPPQQMRETLDRASEMVPAAAWAGIFATLDESGDRQREHLARAAAYACSGSRRELVRAAIVERLDAIYVQGVASEIPAIASPLLMAACHMRAVEAVPAMRRALLDKPAHWQRIVVPVLEQLGTVAALSALAAHHVTLGQRAWSEARDVRARGFEQHGHAAFMSAAQSDCPGARALALEAGAQLEVGGARFAWLEGALEDEHEFVRIRAIRLLAHTKGDARREAARELLVRRLAAGPLLHERRALVFALPMLGDTRTLEAMHAFEDGDRRRSERERAALRASWERMRELCQGSKRARAGELLGELLDGAFEF